MQVSKNTQYIFTAQVTEDVSAPMAPKLEVRLMKRFVAFLFKKMHLNMGALQHLKMVH